MSGVRDLLTGVVAADRLRDGGAPVVGAAPEVTVTPASVDEVAAVLRAASADGFGVVPFGGATSLGPTPPEGPFVALSTAGLQEVEAYEPADLTLSGGAGITLGRLEAETAPHAQWLPFDPERAPARTLGGLAATGVRSPLCASYGAPRDHILGLTLVTGDGRVLKLGGRVMKNVAGFDLLKLAVGSRGTLGVVVSVTVRLFPRPQRDVALVLEAKSPDELVAAVRALATAPVLPASAMLVAGDAVGASGASGASGTNARADGDAATKGSAPDASALVVRVSGAPDSVAEDATRLQAHVGARFRMVEGAAALALFESVRDHLAGDPVVVRVTTLPTSLGDVVAAAAAVAGGLRTQADVLAGKVRLGAGALPADALAALRGKAEELGGSCVVERGPAALARVEAAAGRTAASSAPEGRGRRGEVALAEALRASFDPRGVLWPGGAR